MIQQPLARVTDPQTSHAAAERAQVFIGSHEARIRKALRGSFGMTAMEIAGVTHLTSVQVSRRLPFMDDVSKVLGMDDQPLTISNFTVWALKR